MVVAGGGIEQRREKGFGEREKGSRSHRKTHMANARTANSEIRTGARGTSTTDGGRHLWRRTGEGKATEEEAGLGDGMVGAGSVSE